MEQWLPSRKLVLSFGALAIVLVGSFFVSKNKQNKISTESNNVVVLGSFREKLKEIDSDNDGLKDWEENLWKTDKNNPDTDGDGTPDNEEILNQRNPLVKGPNDKMTEIKLTEGDKNIPDNQELTGTENLSRNVIEGYLSMKMMGTLTQEKQEDMVEYMTKNALQNLNITDKFFSLSDITITDKNSRQGLDDYKYDLISIMNLNNRPKKDFENLIKALEQKNENLIYEITKSIDIYKEMLQDLSNMSVPSSLARYHIDLMNSFSGMIKSTEYMSKIFTDPVSAMAGVSERIEFEEKMMGALENLNTIIEK